MHGIYTDPVIVMSCCLICAGLHVTKQNDLSRYTILFSRLYKHYTCITANEDGVHFTAIYDWRTETGTWLYIYVQSRQLSTFLIKLRENLNNYGENMLQTRCRTSVTPIIKTQYGPHSFSRLSREKLLSCSMQRWRERDMQIQRDISKVYLESQIL